MEEELIRKIVPHNLEAEKSVIGSMLLDSDAIIAATEVVSKEDFYQPQYAALFEGIVDLFNSNIPVDVLTLQNCLKEKGLSSELCSVEVISNLLNSVPTSANVRYYAKIVRDKAVLRRLIKTTEKITDACYLDKEKVEDILESTEKQIFSLVQEGDSGEYVPVKKVVLEALDRIDAASKASGKITGIPSGFIDLDYRMSGLQPSDLILIAARPSMGKTAFVLNIAQHIAVKKNITAAVFSLEMSKVQLVNRMLSLESLVEAQHIRNGDLTENEWRNLIEAADSVAHSNLIIDDTPGISVKELRSKCRKYKLEHNLGIIIIDYLQLMTGSKNSESRQNEVADISRNLKAIARELNVPVVALSQLSRTVESREDKRPMLSDLRESGAIEQDADVVMFIYRDEYYHKDSDDKGIAEIIIAKQRNGPIGTVKLKWLPEYTKFANLEKEYNN